MVVFFMTDGCETCNPPHKLAKSREVLQDVITKYEQEVIVHSLGFGANHNDAFLESLTRLGTADGSYNFISPKEGDKFTQLSHIPY